MKRRIIKPKGVSWVEKGKESDNWGRLGTLKGLLFKINEGEFSEEEQKILAEALADYAIKFQNEFTKVTNG